MLAAILSFRFVLLLAALGSMAGALMMFWEGAVKLKLGFVLLAWGGAAGNDKAVIAAIMSAVDKYLFGLVLVILAYAITFGFVLDLDATRRERLPAWMKVSGVAELKHTFFEVILVYLAVDFATDVASSETHLSWETLVMPLSILALAGAMRLLTHTARTSPPEVQAGSMLNAA